MRGNFDRQLETLHTELILMGALCEKAIANAAKALTSRDGAFVEKTSQAEAEIDEKERHIERICLGLLLMQQPVAKDLRQVSAALKIITDMERIGDQAADIAEISTHLAGDARPENFCLDEMARATITMVTGSIDAYVKQDVGMARMVMRQDDKVDALFLQAREQLISLITSSPGQGGNALDLLMTAKYLERIGDHAVNIAEWVVFSVTGDRSA